MRTEVWSLEVEAGRLIAVAWWTDEASAV